MTNRYNILNLLLSALVLLLPSCISLEDYETDADRSKTIEFVCRPTSYDGQEVLTKATTVDASAARLGEHTRAVCAKFVA